CEKLENERPKEGVNVLGLLQAWDDTKGKDVVEMVADFGREVIIEDYEQPCYALSFLEGGKAVGGEA
ncbi:hypothetical protein DXG03_003329, partial [Asterophora parasitica]